MRRPLVLLTAVLLALGIALPAAAQDGDTADVTLVHGVRGLLADVYLDGDLVLEGFAPERVTDPITVPAGDHDVAVREADAAADSAPVVEASVSLAAGDDVSAVVHVVDGEPRVALFDNPVRDVSPGQGALVVRHTAAAGSVDVLVDDATVVEGLSGDDEQVVTLAAGPHQLTVVAAGADDVVLPAQDLSVEEGTATAVYLTGAAADDTLGWLVQGVPAAAGAPAGVPAGDSGLVATEVVDGAAGVAPVAAASLLLVLGLALLARRRTVRA